MKLVPALPADKSAGFTLIELMVTVAIAAILTTIAVSMYTTQVRQSRRSEARTALLDMASREERFSSTNSVYSSAPANLGYSGTFPVTVGSGYYQVTALVCAAVTCAADAGTGAAFLLTATPVGGTSQAKDAQCASFTLDNTGAQNVTGAASTTPSTCWNN
jgi:type IV pilus assembly protein PilE